jgi:hypothetical protein
MKPSLISGQQFCGKAVRVGSAGNSRMNGKSIFADRREQVVRQVLLNTLSHFYGFPAPGKLTES